MSREWDADELFWLGIGLAGLLAGTIFWFIGWW